MLAALASDAVIDSAYQWLCNQRRRWPADADIWDLRVHWPNVKRALQHDLLRGEYRFESMLRVAKGNGEIVHVWGLRDALVLKALAIILDGRLPVSQRCTHVKGHGGAKAAVRAVRDNLPDHSFVMRTDVRGYYDNIDQYRMLEQLAVHIKDRVLLNYL